jgi:predicted transcriptional regulator
MAMFKRVFSRKGVTGTSKSFRIPNTLLDKLQKLADQEGETVNQIVVLILDQYFQLEEADLAPAPPDKSAS